MLMSTALRRTGNTVMVGVGFIEYFESHAAFTEFTVPIDYLDPENSESCIISFTLNQVFGHATSVVLDSLWFEEGTIGIDERSAEVGLRITPNPAVDRVTIAASAQGPVHILDMRGRLVMDLSDRRKPSFTVDVSVLPAGLYSVISYNDREVEVARFMKQ